MSGRGARLFSSLIICMLLFTGIAWAAPELALKERPGLSPYRLCQNPPAEDFDVSPYFTRPAREGEIVYVFYNNIINLTDDAQVGYALFYGLEVAAAEAEADDTIAVGLYYSDQNGEIFLIQKNIFERLHAQKLTVEALLKHLRVKKVDMAKSGTSFPG